MVCPEKGSRLVLYAPSIGPALAHVQELVRSSWAKAGFGPMGLAMGRSHYAGHLLPIDRRGGVARDAPAPTTCKVRDRCGPRMPRRDRVSRIRTPWHLGVDRVGG